MNRDEIEHWRRMLSLANLRVADEHFRRYAPDALELGLPYYPAEPLSQKAGAFLPRRARLAANRRGALATLVGKRFRVTATRFAAKRTPWSHIQHCILHYGYLLASKKPVTDWAYSCLPDLRDVQYITPWNWKKYQGVFFKHLRAEVEEYQQTRLFHELSGSPTCLPPVWLRPDHSYPPRCNAPLCRTCTATRIAKLCARFYRLIRVLQRDRPRLPLRVFVYRADYWFPGQLYPQVDDGRPPIHELFRDMIAADPPDLRHDGKASITLVWPYLSMRSRICGLRIGMLGLIEDDDYQPVAPIRSAASQVVYGTLTSRMLPSLRRWTEAATVAFNLEQPYIVSAAPRGATNALLERLAVSPTAVGVRATGLLYARDITTAAARWGTVPRNARRPKISEAQYQAWLDYRREHDPKFRPPRRRPGKPKPGVPYSDAL